MKNALSLLLLPLALGCVVEGSGDIQTDEFDIGEPTHVSVCCGFEVVVTQGKKSSLTITGDDNLLDQILVDERRDEITIGFPESIGGFDPSEPVRVELTLPELRELDAESEVDIHLKGAFDTDEFDVELSGGSELRLDELHAKKFSYSASGDSVAHLFGVDVDELEIEASGGSWIRLDGRATTLEGEFSGGSQLTASECRAEDVELELSGESFVDVHVQKTLRVEASGGSEVLYSGDPKVTKTLSDSHVTRK